MIPQSVPEASVSHSRVVAGRASRLTWAHAAGEVRPWNVHNYCLSDDQMVDMTERLTEDIEWAVKDPLRRIVMLMGDFNVQAEAGVVDYAMPAESRAVVAPGIHRARWTRTWAMLTELSAEAPSHYTPAAGVARRPGSTVCL